MRDFQCINNMNPVSEMIVQNVCQVDDPQEVRLMTMYVSNVIQQCRPSINRAKHWHDCIFRPRYYYTMCPDTLNILSRIQTKQMTRHVITLHSVIPLSSLFLVEVGITLQRILDAGLCVVYYINTDAFRMTSTNDIYKATSIEMILEAKPFEEEYVSNLKGFNRWLDKQLPRTTLCR
jgi:hypothetical protein